MFLGKAGSLPQSGDVKGAPFGLVLTLTGKNALAYLPLIKNVL
jgi:hypothetical protein